VDGYGSHHTLLAARFVVRAPEGWICQRSGRVPWLVPLVTQTLLSRTRPCLRVYCKTAKKNPRASPSTFQSTAAASMVTILFRSRSKNMSKEDLRLCYGQTSPHRPRLVVSRSTCPPLSPSPPSENSSVLGTTVINTRTWGGPWKTSFCCLWRLGVPPSPRPPPTEAQEDRRATVTNALRSTTVTVILVCARPGDRGGGGSGAP
jgi:hypothetical protein